MSAIYQVQERTPGENYVVKRRVAPFADRERYRLGGELPEGIGWYESDPDANDPVADALGYKTRRRTI